METQALEHTEKWREVRADFVRRFGEGYATYLTRLAGHNVPLRSEIPDWGLYRAKSKDETRWLTVNYCSAGNGKTKCLIDVKYVDEKMVRGEVITEDSKHWVYYWQRACRFPITKQEYEHLQQTGLLPGESKAAAADRGNVVSIESARDKAVPTATEDRVVTTTHNQPPAEDTYETLLDRYERLKIEADSILKKGAVQTKEEADRVTDLKDRFLKIEKRAEELYKAEMDPVDQQVKAVRAKWKFLRSEPGNLKKRLNASVITPWLKAEQDRLKAERAAQIEAGADPNDLQSTAVRTGSGLGRQTSLHTTRRGKIIGRDAFLAYVKNQEAISEALQKLADVFAKNKIDPIPPGLEYEEVSGAA